jgi:hypothetical protein
LLLQILSAATFCSTETSHVGLGTRYATSNSLGFIPGSLSSHREASVDPEAGENRRTHDS